jgi:hypothetical protein
MKKMSVGSAEPHGLNDVALMDIIAEDCIHISKEGSEVQECDSFRYFVLPM